MSSSPPPLTYYASEGHILYRALIRDSFRAAGFNLKKNDPKSVLVWYDDLRKKDFYGPMKPWQIVNRFPMVNVICRKAPFVRLIQRTAQTFPSQFKFLPKSFLVPIQQEAFEEEVHKNLQRFIVKPDRGSLGEGIKIIEIGGTIPKIERLCVAQEYIPSFHIDDYKFDFRIYALVASIDPLRIYVYRNGVARFCSKKANEHSVFSELTNKSLNKKNPDVVMTQIVKMIADVMTRLKSEGHDTDRLWSRIDRAIVSTVITASKFMKNGMDKQCPKIGIQRCFQILGFDVLLDPDLNPYILEVNYRPSLETNANYERKMKLAMLSDTMKIMAPAQEFQDYVMNNYDEDLADRWPDLIMNDPELKEAVRKTNEKLMSTEDFGGFVLAYPTPNERLMKKWTRMIEFVGKMPTELRSRYFLPPALKKKQKEPTSMDTSMTEIEDKERLEAMRRFEEDRILDPERLREEEKEMDEIETAIDENEARNAEEFDLKLKRSQAAQKGVKRSGRSSKRNSGKNSKRGSAKVSKRSSRKSSPTPEKEASDDDAPKQWEPAPPLKEEHKKELIRKPKVEKEETSSDEEPPKPAPKAHATRKSTTKRQGTRRRADSGKRVK